MITTLFNILLDSTRLDFLALILIFAFSSLILGILIPTLMSKFKKSKCRKLTVELPFIKIQLEK